MQTTTLRPLWDDQIVQAPNLPDQVLAQAQPSDLWTLLQAAAKLVKDHASLSAKIAEAQHELQTVAKLLEIAKETLTHRLAAQR